MKKSLLSWLKQLAYPKKSETGFTLVEVLVVVIIIGIIATIAGPSWLTFTNQRRVTAANDVVLRALQEAQSKAKKEKVSYSVSFKTDPNKVPELAIYRTTIQNSDGTTSVVDPTASGFNGWRSLGKDLAFKPGQVILGTNLKGENQTDVGTQFTYTASATSKITFDYMGALPNASIPPNKALIILVAAPVGNSNDPIPSTRRCVKIKTLLGAIQPGKTTECDP